MDEEVGVDLSTELGGEVEEVVWTMDVFMADGCAECSLVVEDELVPSGGFGCSSEHGWW